MVSAVFSLIAREHEDLGTSSFLPLVSVMASMAIGVQYVPRLANAAYVEAMPSGVLSVPPSVIDGWLSETGLPSPRS